MFVYFRLAHILIFCNYEQYPLNQKFHEIAWSIHACNQYWILRVQFLWTFKDGLRYLNDWQSFSVLPYILWYSNEELNYTHVYVTHKYITIDLGHANKNSSWMVRYISLLLLEFKQFLTYSLYCDAGCLSNGRAEWRCSHGSWGCWSVDSISRENVSYDWLHLFPHCSQLQSK